MKLFATVLFAAGALTVSAQTSAYHIDPVQTQVNFTLGDILHTVHGSFKLKSGEIQFDPSTGAASGEMIVDATSGDSGSSARDSRMHKNILESNRYPEIVFRPDHIIGTLAPEGPSQVQVHGAFIIHGASHEITIPAQVQMGQNQFTATMHFVVPYVAWGMKNPSNFILRVNDKVDIDIHTVGAVTSAAAVESLILISSLLPAISARTRIGPWQHRRARAASSLQSRRPSSTT